MKNKAKLILLVAISLITNSCINDFELDTGDGSPLVVIEGQIDNDGNNYVRLTYNNPSLQSLDHEPFTITNAIPVKHATVIVKDNTGYIEIMKPATNEFNEFKGYYTAENLIGKAGNTYSLEVTIEGRTFTAKAYMPPVPEIDSVGLQFVQGNPGKPNSSQPLIYFSEPQDKKNYYLTKTCIGINSIEPGINCRNIGELWNFSILDDNVLDAYVSGLNLNDGETPKGRDFNIPIFGFDIVELQMYSLTKEAFEYYEALIKQFNNDGGIYQPSPASAPSNIKGGALGFFNASAVSKKLIEFDPG